MPPRRWRIRLGTEAERDFIYIVRWTAATFGRRQAGAYRTTLTAALLALRGGPNIAGSVRRDDILPGLRTLHVARRRRRGSHFILYRPMDPDIIEVVRILHERMDLGRHLPQPTGA